MHPEQGSAFGQYFQVVPAATEALKEQVYLIRHRVYCEDLGFEVRRPDRLEHDEYDGQSLHLLIRSVLTGEFIGCTRIIRPSPDRPHDPLPFELACRDALDRGIIDPERLARDRIAEVSRLAVIREFRRRKGEESIAVPISEEDFGTESRPRFPYIPIGLYLATVELARMNGIDTLFVLTEPRLAHHFGKLGVRITAIGTPVEHRGLRLPSMMDTHRIIEELRPTFQPLYHSIVADLHQELESDAV